jgi:peptidoglycan/LPS O-acetylase OafA/YrhL
VQHDNAGWKRGEIVSLTSLRGIAALGVAAMHISRSSLLSREYLWVDFFFLLSGFILCHAYAGLFRNGISVRAAGLFFKARFFRIYPMHFAPLMVLVAIETAKWMAARGAATIHHAAFQPPFSLPSLLLNLLLVQNWGLSPELYTWNMPAWSISTEAAAYILFPLLFVFFARDKWARLGLTIVSLAGLFFFWLRAGGMDLPSLSRCVCEFWLGMMIYRIGPIPIGPGMRNVLQLASIIAVGLVLQTGVPDILAVPCFMLLIPLCGSDSGALGVALKLPALRFFGLISYSIYMTHMVVLLIYEALESRFSAVPFYSGPGLHRTATTLVLLAAVIGVSTLTYRYVEIPLRKLGRGRFAPAQLVTDAP